MFAWFQDTNPDVLQMAAGKGAISVVSVDIPTIEHGGKDENVTGEPVTITSTNGKKTSGWYRGEADIKTAYYSTSASPTGERFIIRSIAFKEIETQDGTPAGDSCSGNVPFSGECAAKFQGRCFKNVAEACDAAACGSASCQVEETYPALVECG